MLPLIAPTADTQVLAREILADLLKGSRNSMLFHSAEELSRGPEARAERLFQQTATQLLATLNGQAADPDTRLRLEATLREIDAAFAHADLPAPLGRPPRHSHHQAGTVTESIVWSRREPPLAAAAVVATGNALSSLRTATIRGLERQELRAVGGDDWLVVLGSELPWADGSIYLGWDSGILVPTTALPSPPAAILRPGYPTQASWFCCRSVCCCPKLRSGQLILRSWAAERAASTGLAGMGRTALRARRRVGDRPRATGPSARPADHPSGPGLWHPRSARRVRRDHPPGLSHPPAHVRVGHWPMLCPTSS